MATFKQLRLQMLEMCQDIANYTGVKKSLVMNVIRYTKMLPRPETPDCVDEHIFMAQMSHQFGITSKFHIRLIYDAVMDKTLKYVRIIDYAKMVCIFYSKRLALKVDFVFSVYDQNGNGEIEVFELYHILKTSIVSLGDDEPEDYLKDLIDVVIGMMDTNHDGKISIEEFREYVRNDILYIQLLGQVLPLEHVIEEFMNALKCRTPQEVDNLFRQERSICLHEPMRKVAVSELYPIPLELP